MKQLPWLRAVGTVLVIGIAAGYIGLRYRVSDAARIFRGTDPLSQMAVLRYLAGDVAGAAKMLRGRQALRGNAEEMPGLAAYVSGDLARAEHEANAALTRDPKHAQARLTLAEVALTRSDPKRARTYARANIDAGVFQPFNAHLLAGIASVHMGARDEALNHFTIAARSMHAGNRDSVLLALMALLGEMEADGRATREPALTASIYRLLSFWEPGALRAASRYATHAIRAGKDVSHGWLTLCAARYAKRQYEPALSACDAASEERPNADAHWLRAYIYAARADLPREAEAVMKARAAAPADAFIVEGTLYVLAEKLGDYPRVKAIGEAALADHTPSARTLLWLAHANTYLGDHALAVTQHQQARALEPRDPDIALRLARSLHRTKAFTEALAAARAASTLSPNWNAPYELMGTIHFDRAEYAMAVSAYEAGFAKQAPVASQLVSLCVAYLRAGNFEKASRCIDAVLRAEPENALANRLRYEVNLNRDLGREEKREGAKI